MASLVSKCFVFFRQEHYYVCAMPANQTKFLSETLSDRYQKNQKTLHLKYYAEYIIMSFFVKRAKNLHFRVFVHEAD